MYTLGISYGFHDASAALVSGGKILAAAAEERFSRQKHDNNFPQAAIEYCLEQAGVGVEALSRVVYHESPSQTFTRVVASSLATFPRSRREFSRSMKAWFGKKLWVENDISSRLGIAPEQISFLSHHQSHALQAFLGSGFDEAAVLTIDAVGEWATTSLVRARLTASGPVLEPLAQIDFPHSLGLFYSAFTAYLGFIPMDGECSVMALAAFGQPKFAAEIRKILQWNAASGTFSIDQRYFNFHRYYSDPFTKDLIDLLGPARTPDLDLPFACAGLAPGSQIGPEAQRFADIAASVQLVFEDTVLELVQRLHRLTGLSKLCFAGGAALNCVANARILREGPFKTLYIPPDPGDGGAAAGAALYGDAKAAAKKAAESLENPFQPWLGPTASARELEDMLPHLVPDKHRRYAKIGYKQAPGERWEWQSYESEQELVNVVADLIAGRQIIGWVQGRAENGPRALGARSILIRPDDAELAARLSRDVKDRAAYRPYALSMTSEDAPRILGEIDPSSTPHKWMQLAAAVLPAAQSAVKSGLHVDNTTRPQVCSASDQPRYHALLTAVGERLGLGCLVNTSFNESGYPLVSSGLEALAVFARTGMNALVVDNLIIRKVR